MLAVFGIPNVVVAAIAATLLAIVARRRVFGANERTETSWLDAWLKAIVIVVFVVFTTVYLPSYVIGMSAVSDLNRNAQDLISAGIWGAAFTATLGGLWYAHREKRV